MWHIQRHDAFNEQLNTLTLAANYLSTDRVFNSAERVEIEAKA